MEEMKISDERARHVELMCPRFYLQTLYIFYSILIQVKASSYVLILNLFLLIFLYFLYLAQPLLSTLTSYHRSLSFALASILLSLGQTIKQVFPWLSCNSPLPVHHPIPETARVSYSSGSSVVLCRCRFWTRIWVPQDQSAVYRSALMGVTKTPDMHALLFFGEGEWDLKCRKETVLAKTCSST